LDAVSPYLLRGEHFVGRVHRDSTLIVAREQPIWTSNVHEDQVSSLQRDTCWGNLSVRPRWLGALYADSHVASPVKHKHLSRVAAYGLSVESVTTPVMKEIPGLRGPRSMRVLR
jgi:hypothetical protein